MDSDWTKNIDYSKIFDKILNLKWLVLLKKTIIGFILLLKKINIIMKVNFNKFRVLE